MLAAGILLVLSLAAHAQGNDDTRPAGPVKFAITSFGQDPFDISPTNKEYEKIDGNGARYAIIKVTSTNPEDDLRAYRFNFGNLKSIVEEHNGQLWVYVQRNAKMVTITRKGYATIDKHDLGVTIESGKTYTMQLSSVAKPTYNQAVMFNVEPADSKAKVMVKSVDLNAREEEFGTINAKGMVTKSLPLGTYTYRVLADNYNVSEGRITLNDRNNMHIEEVMLTDSALYTFHSQPSDAQLYINGQLMGATPYTAKLASGSYKLMLKRAHYRTLTERVDIVRSNPEMEYTMKMKKNTYLKPTTGYIFGGFFAGTTWGAGCGIGAYIHNVNVEFNIPFHLGMQGYYNGLGSDRYRCSMEFYPTFTIDTNIDTKLGYGFIMLKERLRITPQLGYSYFPMSIRGKVDDGNPETESATIHAITLGARVEFALHRNIGIFLTPVGQFAIKKSSFFSNKYVKEVKANSSKWVDYWPTWGRVPPSKINRTGTDFYVQLGLYFNI